MLAPFKRVLKRVPGVTPGTRSLQRHLLLWLLLPQLVLWLAVAWVTCLELVVWVASYET